MRTGADGGGADAPRGPSAVRIRRAGPADLEAMEALERHFAADRFDRRQLRHLLTRAHAAAYLAEDPTGAAIGDAIVLFRRGDEAARLYSLVVAPEARGHGVGGALLTAAEAGAAERGARAMRLEVREDNAAALRLYRGRGYEPVGRREGYYHDGRAAQRMRRDLDRGWT